MITKRDFILRGSYFCENYETPKMRNPSTPKFEIPSLVVYGCCVLLEVDLARTFRIHLRRVSVLFFVADSIDTTLSEFRVSAIICYSVSVVVPALSLADCQTRLTATSAF